MCCLDISMSWLTEQRVWMMRMDFSCVLVLVVYLTHFETTQLRFSENKQAC